jgi:hypothetical protein
MEKVVASLQFEPQPTSVLEGAPSLQGTRGKH